MIQKIGIISGVEAELAAFLPDAETAIIRIGTLRVRHLVHGGKQLYLACAGIGKVAAATMAASLYGQFGVDALLVIGTAGKLIASEHHVFKISEAMQSDYGAQRDSGFVHYTAGSMPIGPAVLRHFEALSVPGLDLPEARIASGDMFVESGVHARRLAETFGAALIDMETASVAHAAQLLGIPWLAIKATTDGADEGSADSFVANLAAAANLAARSAEELLGYL